MDDDARAGGDGTSDGPPESLLPYDTWTEESLRGVIARALRHAMIEGLPGEHHFYITFQTGYPGVSIPARLLAKYPKEMTIVLQHQFDKLLVDEAAGLFGVSLSFGGVLSALTVPFAAITAFVDPHVQFGLRFAVPAPAEPPAAAPVKEAAPPAKDTAPPGSQDATPQVVSLDAFRRKRD